MAATQPYARERAVAEAAALRAALLTKRVLSTVSSVTKHDASPVTVADFAAQALLIAALHAAFPSDAFVGEEDSAELRRDGQLLSKVFDLVGSSSSSAPTSTASTASATTNGNNDGSGSAAAPAIKDVQHMLKLIDMGGSGKGGPKGRFWVMDPVDGTATFLKGQQYAVSLSLVEDGREVVGVLCCPNLLLTPAGRVAEASVDAAGAGVMMTAVRGQGATIRRLAMPPAPAPLAAAAEPQRLADLVGPKNLKDVHFVDSLSSKTSRHDVVAGLAKDIGAAYPGTDVWSSHVRYAAMILGGGDVHVRVPVSATAKTYIWDHAGAQLIFTELGGKITDLDGKDIDFGAGRTLSNNRGMLIARGDTHGNILELLRKMTWT
ncbi:hypothetical protein N3K66_001417 [Trichothecium roseum]|uniref:Uncharacterized protein n=1 Tax=Trichothecium roseum TaxID=47278 RepID=A0ACC0VFJ4_9HYPO|nr:hypothetical protein N3K66_001417 [Trichothecium roseum]